MTTGQDDIEAYGDYETVREIGRGGMGIVYEVVHRRSGQRFAIKVLPLDRSRDPKVVSRFQREAEAVRKLSHPNIITIHDFDREGDLYYFVMDLVSGRNLEDIILELKRRKDDVSSFLSSVDSEEDGPNDDRRRDHRTPAYVRAMVKLLADVADALAYSHSRGMIHRDLKPSNLILSRDRRLVLTDFGLVRDVQMRTMTQSGEILGTPLYMSPEQIAAERKSIDGRTDVYSLGVTLYEALTLEAPYDGESLPVLVRQIQFESPLPMSRRNPAVPRELENIVSKAMSKFPDARYRSMKEFADDLRRHLRGERPLAKSTNRLARLVELARLRPQASAATALILALAFVLSIVLSKNYITRTKNDELEISRYVEDARALCRQEAFLSAWRTCENARRLHPESHRLRQEQRAVSSAAQAALASYLEADPPRLDDAANLHLHLRQMLPLGDGGTADLGRRLSVSLEAAIRSDVTALEIPRARRYYERLRSIDLGRTHEELDSLARDCGTELWSNSRAAAQEFRYSKALMLAEAAIEWNGEQPDGAGELDLWRSPGCGEIERVVERLHESLSNADAVLRDLARPKTFIMVPRIELVRFVRRYLAREVPPDSRRAFIDFCRRLRLFEATPELLTIAESQFEFRRVVVEAFTVLKDPRAVEFLVRQLDGQPDSSLERSVIVALAGCDDEIATAALEKIVKDETAPIDSRILAAWASNRGAGTHLAAGAATLLENEEARTSPMLLETLERADTALDGDALRALFESTVDGEIKGRIVRLLGRATGEQRSYLEGIVRSNEPERIRAEAARTIGKCFGSDGVEFLRACYSDAAYPPQVRALAAVGLGEAGGEAAARALLEHFSGNVAAARQAALLALARLVAVGGSVLSDPTIATMVQALRGDVSDDVRAAAAHGLARLEVHWSAPFLTEIVDRFEPDVTSDVLKSLFGSGRSGQGGISDLIESYGAIGLLLPGASAFLSGENTLILACCNALGHLAGRDAWKDATQRTAAIRALFRASTRPGLPIKVARAVLEALACFESEVALADLVDLMKRFGDVDVLSSGALIFARRGLADEAAEIWDRIISEMRPEDCYRRACASMHLNDEAGAVEWLAKAVASGFAHPERWREDPVFASLAGRPAFETLVASS